MPLAHKTRATTPEPAPDCSICPRLVAFRATNRTAHPDWFNGAVPSFGPDSARLLIVGLAPGLKGANRTGRPFLGDYAGELLYRTLLKVGLARGAHAHRLHDHQRGALRAAGQQADPERDRPLPKFPGGADRRPPRLACHLGAWPHRP